MQTPLFVFSIAHEQCCQSAVRDRLCDKGIRMSREQGACERPFFQGEAWETKISKVVLSPYAPYSHKHVE